MPLRYEAEERDDRGIPDEGRVRGASQSATIVGVSWWSVSPRKNAGCTERQMSIRTRPVTIRARPRTRTSPTPKNAGSAAVIRRGAVAQCHDQHGEQADTAEQRKQQQKMKLCTLANNSRRKNQMQANAVSP